MKSCYMWEISYVMQYRIDCFIYESTRHYGTSLTKSSGTRGGIKVLHLHCCQISTTKTYAWLIVTSETSFLLKHEPLTSKGNVSQDAFISILLLSRIKVIIVLLHSWWNNFLKYDINCTQKLRSFAVDILWRLHFSCLRQAPSRKMWYPSGPFY